MGQCKTTLNKKCHKCGFSPSKDSSGKSLSEIFRHECIQVKPNLKENLQSQKTMGKQNDIKKMMKNPQSNNLKLKVPIDSTNTKFKWINVQVNNIKGQVLELKASEIKNESFQEKMAWLKEKIAQKKKQNSVGYDVIQIDRENIIQSSLNSLQGTNFYKDLIIQFKGDKAQDAGGGLLRQWMHLCIQKIMSEELGIFKQCKTDETAYQLVCDSSASDEQTIQALYLLGLIIGKAMIQNISLDCHLDYTIIRQICSQPIHLSDIYSYDKQFYQSWKNILEIHNLQQLYLDGTVYLRFKQGKTQQIDILPNGKNILITNQNKQEYISGMINLYCTKIIESYLEELINSLTAIIPNEWLSIFQPWEFQMIISGPSIIDIQDWKKNTIYDSYEPQDQVIQWFWEIVESYGQQGYKNLLHYCTGSKRIPIMGFGKLQSSHGHIKKFSIRKIDYNIDNPYPKSYTCFNRLDLPQYSSKQQLKEKLSFILEQEFSYFGLC